MEAQHHAKVKIGIVESNKMEKSVSIRVTRHAMHPVYGKRIIVSKKFIAHDEENSCRPGDKVLISETRPMSRTKCWTVVRIIERAPVFGAAAKQEEA